jgi:phosphoribosylformylglycinamidine (FGAM) synthase-like amidotransferase family enzyme
VPRKKVRAIVLYGYGINCEAEMAHGCRLAGADVVDIVHLNELLRGEVGLYQYHLLNLPGGFLDGDDLGAAKAAANRLRYAKVGQGGERFQDQLLGFIKEGKLIFGVCNGFQLMVKLGLIPGFDARYETQQVTLTFNDSGRFEDRWVYLKIDGKSPCIFTRGIKGVYLPVRHGEGKFIPGGEEVRRKLRQRNLIVARYSDPSFTHEMMDYPLNPNGSIDAVAGICDESGRLFGMMPHPEAYLHFTNHPRWTREDLPEEGMGLAFFRNAVEYIREELI